MEQENFSNFIEELEKKSDNELANFLILEQSSKRDAVKAILDSRMIKSMQQLTKIIGENNIKTEKYNNSLTNLTRWIFILTMVMTLATIISIFKKLFFSLLSVIL